MEKRNPMINKINAIIYTFIFAFVAVAVISCGSGPPKNSRAAQSERGKVHFDKYCAVCHGNDGKGIARDTLNERPADLTRILLDRRVGDFPIAEIARIIDGRNMTKSHGTRAMPVWGEVFTTEEELNERELKGKLGEIIAYLMSIQQ